MLTELVDRQEIDERFRKVQPIQPLRSFIEYFQETGEAGNDFTLRYLPDLGALLVFQWEGGAQLPLSVPDHLMVPGNTTWIQQGRFFTIKFKPGFFPGISGFREEIIPGVPIPARKLLEQNYISGMEAAETFEERVRISEEHFSAIFAANSEKLTPYRIVGKIIEALSGDREMDNRIGSSSRDSFISSRSMQRYFQKSIGITPKTAYCILRLRRALESYFNHPASFDCYDFDYYDYSHFYKEVEKITGLRLTQLRVTGM
jgi:AraC-like DNA-binding protein